MADDGMYQYRDPTSLVNWAKLLIYARLAITCIAVLSGFLEYDLLIRLQAGSFEYHEAAVSAAEANDARQRLVTIAQTAISIVCAIVVLRWIHRANWNARALGARSLEFTPGWAIGCYFVPVIHFWKPYQAMREIWEASANPAEWHEETAPALVGFWWFFWIVNLLLWQASFRMSMSAKAINELINANIVTLIFDLSVLPLCFVFLVLLRRIDEMQSHWRNASNTELPLTQNAADDLDGATV